jgi:hypothetical protein
VRNIPIFGGQNVFCGNGPTAAQLAAMSGGAANNLAGPNANLPASINQAC